MPWPWWTAAPEEEHPQLSEALSPVDSGHVRGTATTNQHLTGFWRIGVDNLGHWHGAPTSAYFKGSIDEVAVYPTALSASAVHKPYTVDVITPAAALLSAPSTKARAAVAAGVGAPAPVPSFPV